MLSLADAIIDENIYQVQDLLRYGINLNQIDEYGFTPLIEAAIANNTDIARLLISHGAHVTMQDSVGGTALHWAAENNNLALAEILLANGADPNAYNLSGQPVLLMPVLRQQQKMKRLLISAGANLDFTQDFINTKFLGHLFELVGTANIISPSNEFVEVNFEGFFLEVTLAMITDSLIQFRSHFAGRQIRQYLAHTELIINVMDRAAQLIKYQQYQTNLKKCDANINSLLEQEPLILPIGYEGHAITFIKLGSILVKCDRREESRLYDNVVFYQIGNPKILSLETIKTILYTKLSDEFVNEELPRILALEPITELKVTAQISGNCSWANVEACIPVLYFLLFSKSKDFEDNLPRYKTLALNFFEQWREWNKDRALNFCIQSFKESDSLRKACKAEILAAILFQCCQDESVKGYERAESILSLLMGTPYESVLQNYVQSYSYEDQSEEGKHFLQMLKNYKNLHIG